MFTAPRKALLYYTCVCCTDRWCRPSFRFRGVEYGLASRLVLTFLFFPQVFSLVFDLVCDNYMTGAQIVMLTEVKLCLQLSARPCCIILVYVAHYALKQNRTFTLPWQRENNRSTMLWLLKLAVKGFTTLSIKKKR